MKNKTTFLFITISLLLFSCDDKIHIEFNSRDDSSIVVPETIEPEESVNDPQRTGLACDSNHKNEINVELIEKVEIPDDLPKDYDLSKDMPPVRSQGNQGSCAAWATTYYLKSYQEKIQHGYEYKSYENVMSPAFTYNQTKLNNNCGSGSTITNNLELLKNIGTTNWSDFPYSDQQCSNLPTEDLLETAKKNKIKDYFIVGIPKSNKDINYTLINVVKSLLHANNPIISSFDWKDLVFENKDNNFIASSFSETPTRECGHAVLIVGYSDELNAFKIVNSWGTRWGNDGYAWVSYNFFLPPDDKDYVQGLGMLFIAYDEDEESSKIY